MVRRQFKTVEPFIIASTVCVRHMCSAMCYAIAGTRSGHASCMFTLHSRSGSFNVLCSRIHARQRPSNVCSPKWCLHRGHGFTTSSTHFTRRTLCFHGSCIGITVISCLSPSIDLTDNPDRYTKNHHDSSRTCAVEELSYAVDVLSDVHLLDGTTVNGMRQCCQSPDSYRQSLFCFS